MAKCKYISILEQYREQYETGEITREELSKVSEISLHHVREHIANNNWNVALAQQNRKKLYRKNLYLKIKEYKEAYESGAATITTIAKKVKTHIRFISIVAKQENWNEQARRRKRADTDENNLQKKPKTKNYIKEVSQKHFNKYFPSKTIYDRVNINGTPYTIYKINKTHVRLCTRFYEDWNDKEAEREIALAEMQTLKRPIKAVQRPVKAVKVKQELPLTKEDIEFQGEIYRIQSLLD